MKNWPIALQVYSVREDAELVSHAVAVRLYSLYLRAHIGPLESLAPVDEDSLSHLDAARVLPPLAGDVLSKKIERDIVHPAVRSSIP